ncbi:hypothetical protein CERZMDRAFT_113846 [Cercospora zeae-maydis SCOH1-5]|uniref:Uncharacterized protein n=1 Tax=Cercospora zeae-maydis SCOH1-5 TaxID=717836 RepID=A0A6A6F7V7_9PEZI|nr:hypothetical protein CERZMDRAFT_113846 [Cercospora zeae-maydis SCOH1-5]
MNACMWSLLGLAGPCWRALLGLAGEPCWADSGAFHSRLHVCWFGLFYSLLFSVGNVFGDGDGDGDGDRSLIDLLIGALPHIMTTGAFLVKEGRRLDDEMGRSHWIC